MMIENISNSRLAQKRFFTTLGSINSKLADLEFSEKFPRGQWPSSLFQFRVLAPSRKPLAFIIVPEAVEVFAAFINIHKPDNNIFSRKLSFPAPKTRSLRYHKSLSFPSLWDFEEGSFVSPVTQSCGVDEI